MSLKDFKIFLQDYYNSSLYKDQIKPLAPKRFKDDLSFDFIFIDDNFYNVILRIERKLLTYDFSTRIRQIIRQENSQDSPS